MQNCLTEKGNSRLIRGDHQSVLEKYCLDRFDVRLGYIHAVQMILQGIGYTPRLQLVSMLRLT